MDETFLSENEEATAKNILFQDPDSMNLEGQIASRFLFEKYHHEKTKSDHWEKYIKNTIEFLEQFDYKSPLSILNQNLKSHLIKVLEFDKKQ